VQQLLPYNAYQCGRFGLSCSNFDPKKAVPRPSSFNPFHWVAHAATNLWDNNTFWTTLSWVEVGPGAASFIPGLNVITLPLFVAGAALSSLSTAHSCATGSKHACGFGVTSILVGGGGFGSV
jgi:hypothetical protein